MLYNREILAEISANLGQKETIILTGARQTGKTTLLKQLKRQVEDEKKPAYFLNLENLEYLELLNKSPDNLFKIFSIDKKSAKRTFIFIDEVQYLNNPTNFLKYIYDEYSDFIKLVVSGSSAFYLDKKFKDSLAGRKKIFYLYTLNLRDFLIFKERSDILKYLPKKFSLENFAFLNGMPLSLLEDLEILIEELIIYGGYPRVVLANNPEEKKVVIEEIATSYLKKDIYEADIKQQEKFYHLFRILSAQVGQLVNVNELANTLNISRSSVNHYLYIMQKSFHLALVRPFSRNLRREISKMPKGYFYDLGLRNYFINNFNPINARQDPGQLWENFIFKQLVDKLKINDIHFWRTTYGEEIDFIVKEEVALEAKLQSSGFAKNKYATFFEHYKNIPLYPVSYLITEKDQEKIWRGWLI